MAGAQASLESFRTSSSEGNPLNEVERRAAIVISLLSRSLTGWRVRALPMTAKSNFIMKFIKLRGHEAAARRRDRTRWAARKTIFASRDRSGSATAAHSSLRAAMRSMDSASTRSVLCLGGGVIDCISINLLGARRISSGGRLFACGID